MGPLFDLSYMNRHPQGRCGERDIDEPKQLAGPSAGTREVPLNRNGALPKGHRCYSVDTFSHAFSFLATNCHWHCYRHCCWAIDRRGCLHSAAVRKCSDVTKTRTALRPTESPIPASDFARACTEWRGSKAALCAGFGLVPVCAAMSMPVLESSRRGRVLGCGGPPCGQTR